MKFEYTVCLIPPSLVTGASGKTQRLGRAIDPSVPTEKHLVSQEPSVWVCVPTDDKRDREQAAF